MDIVLSPVKINLFAFAVVSWLKWMGIYSWPLLGSWSDTFKRMSYSEVCLLRWNRCDFFMDINSFTEKHQNREESCTGSHARLSHFGRLRIPVQYSSLFWWFFMNEFMSMKTSRLAHLSLQRHHFDTWIFTKLYIFIEMCWTKFVTIRCTQIIQVLTCAFLHHEQFLKIGNRKLC